MARKKQLAQKSRQRSRTVVKGASGPPRVPESSQGEARDVSLLAAYQDQICELESVLTTLRNRTTALAADLTKARESEVQFIDFFENTPAAYVVHNSMGQISAANRAATQLVGLKASHLHGASMLQFVVKEDVPVWLDHLRRCAVTLRCTSTELNLHTMEGRIVPVQLLTLPRLARFGHPPPSLYTLVLDVTEQRATEAALARSQEDYHRLINTIEGIVWEADVRTMDVTFVSLYAERLLGYPVDQWKRGGFWDRRVYVEDRERVANELAQAAAHGKALSMEYRVVSAGRQIHWLHDSVTIIDRGGRPKLLGVAIDVTKRRNAEEELRRAKRELEERVAERTLELREKVGELEAFSYSISHDLRSPLRAMIGFATLALEEADANDSALVKDYLGRIKSGAERADRLIQDVLSYSRVSRADMPIRAVDLDNLVQQLIAQSAELQPPRAEVEVVRPLRRVMGHEASLSQCILNILNNATKFVLPGVTPKIKVWAELANGRVRVWFEDNGIGIAPSNLSRIFNIFERVHSSAQYPGTGIGLAIVRKAIERLGGNVGVESKPGQGSRFWLELKDSVPNEKDSASNRG